MIKKNEIYETQIIRSGMDGEGIAEIDGMVVFVPRALVGERVSVQILSVKKTFAYGKIVELITKSGARVTPRCPVYEKCGGCELSHAEYSEQLAIKRAKIVSSLRRVPTFDEQSLRMVGAESEYGYRNKISLPVREVGGRLRLGFFAPRSHRFIPHDGCALHGDELNGLARAYLEYMNEAHFSAYCEETGEGYVRHLAVRELSHGYSVTVVVNGDDHALLGRLVNKITDWNGKPVTLYANTNTRDTNVIFGDKFVRLQGNTPQGEMCGVRFELHPASFLQVNLPLAERVFEHIKESLEDADYLVDAYSGIGITSNVFADKVKKVFSVEIVDEAVANARALALANGNEAKIECICGDCEVEIPKVIERIKGLGKTAVFLDPPRKGCDEATLGAVLSAGPDQVIYLSCNPATLARDLLKLTAGGYEISSVTGYDFFAQTKHVESLVCLTRK